jgi:CRP/FNR family transcriptional regulator
MQQLCLPMGLSEADINKLDQIIGRRRKVAKNTSLYRMNDPLTNLYAIRLGYFKTSHVSAIGDQQITGFQMARELLGMDAISTDHHHCDAIALEDSEVCEIPYAQIMELFGTAPTLLRQFHRMMSREITREQIVMLSLGNMRAEQRFAAFLVDLSLRHASLGYSALSFQLRMSRGEIGNYLGMTFETISRMLSALKKQGYIKVNHREIELVDPLRLKELATGTEVCN